MLRISVLRPTLTRENKFLTSVGYIFSQIVTIVATLVQYFSVIFHLPEGLIFGRSLTALVSPLGDACLLLYVQVLSGIFEKIALYLKRNYADQKKNVNLEIWIREIDFGIFVFILVCVFLLKLAQQTCFR